MSKKILITDKVHEILRQGLEEMGFEVSYHPKMSYEDVQNTVGDFNALIINSKVVCDRAFLDRVTHLEFIGRLGSGLDIVDLPHAEKIGLKIISSPEGNANAVGEHALGMLLMLMQKIYPAYELLRQGKWIREAHRGEELRGKTVGIIGFGHTGPAFAGKLAGLEVDILAYDKYKEINDDNVTSSSLDALLERSDVVSIHLPLTDDTQGLVSDSFIKSMKPGSILINTSRGAIVNSASLLRALLSDHLGGVCLDVLENEKPATWTREEQTLYKELLTHPRVAATPHVAGWTYQSLRLIAEVLLQKISRHYDPA